MANEQYLIPLSERTPSERKEISRKGAIACNEKKREKATMREVLRTMLNEIPNKETGLTYQQMATLGLIKGAVKGNANNYKTIVETLGELFTNEENKSTGVIDNLIEALNNAKREQEHK